MILNAAIVLPLAIHLLYVSFVFLGNSIPTIAKWAMKYPVEFLMDITIKAPTFFLLLAFAASTYYVWLSALCLLGMVVSLIRLRVGVPDDHYFDAANPPARVNLKNDL